MKLPTPTQQYIIRLFCGQSKVNARYLWQWLLLRWTLWQDGCESNAIPGYDAPPPDCGKGYPDGWTYAAFCRLAKIAASQQARSSSV